MHCDGKCYLAKRIKAAQDQDEKRAEGRFVHQLFTLESQVSLSENAFEFPVISILTEAEDCFEQNSCALQQAPSPFFHPPQGVTFS